MTSICTVEPQDNDKFPEFPGCQEWLDKYADLNARWSRGEAIFGDPWRKLNRGCPMIFCNDDGLLFPDEENFQTCEPAFREGYSGGAKKVQVAFTPLPGENMDEFDPVGYLDTLARQSKLHRTAARVKHILKPSAEHLAAQARTRGDHHAIQTVLDTFYHIDERRELYGLMSQPSGLAAISSWIDAWGEAVAQWHIEDKDQATGPPCFRSFVPKGFWSNDDPPVTVYLQPTPHDFVDTRYLSIFPTELTDRQQWINWKFIERKDGKRTKFPCTPTDRPDLFLTYEEACENSDKVAFVIQRDDPFTGLDLDNCFDDRGKLKDWAKPIVRLLRGVSYGEVSPSGKGIKFLIRGSKQPGSRCVKLFGDNKEQLEVYDFNRFWTMTGNVFCGFEFGCDFSLDQQSVVDCICEEYLEPEPEQKQNQEIAPPRTPAPFNGSPDLHRRAEAYVGRCDPAGEGNRNNNAFNIAGQLFAIVGESGDRLSGEEVTQYVLDWNARNSEPLDESEILKTVESAGRNGTPRADKPPKQKTSEVATGLDRFASQSDAVAQQNEPTVVATPPETTETPQQRDWRLFKEFERAIELDAMHIPTVEQIGAIERRRGESLRVYSPQEFADADFAVRFIVDQLLVADQPCVIAGPSKSLKTSIGIALAVSVASGEPFLGRYAVGDPQRVLFLSAESGFGTIKRTLFQICDSIGIDPKDLPIHFGDWVPHARQADKLAAIRREMDFIVPGVVFIDPVYQAVDGSDAANLAMMGEQLATICRQVLHFGGTPILVHHTKKTSQAVFEKQPVEIHDLAGAGVTEFFRQWLLVNRRERFQAGEPNKLWLSAGGSAGHASEYAIDIDEHRGSDGFPTGWSIDIRDRRDVAEEQQTAKAKQKDRADEERTRVGVLAVASLFSQDDEAKTYKTLERHSGSSGRGLDLAIAQLIKVGVIKIEIKRARNNKEAEHYSFDRDKYEDVFGDV